MNIYTEVIGNEVIYMGKVFSLQHLMSGQGSLPVSLLQHTDNVWFPISTVILLYTHNEVFTLQSGHSDGSCAVQIPRH